MGVKMARMPGPRSSFWAAAVAIPTQREYSGLFFPSIRPGISRNWRRTSFTNRPAARLTARMANEEKSTGTAAPMSRPMKTGGRFTWMPDSTRPASSMKEAKSEVAAITAVAMANPLVRALVVLPTASSLATMRWAGLSSPPSLSAPDISKMPLALSEMGP